MALILYNGAMQTLKRYWKRTALIVLAILLLVSAGLYAWIFIGLPDLSEIEAGLALPSTRIYDRNNQLLYEILPPEQGRNRTLDLADIPQHCINAVIATEDANYWSHPGVDPEGILRAAWINLRGGEIIAGGSTITQQTARLLLLDPNQQAQRTIRRKLREMVLAIRLQNTYSKAHVLELYLNQVYFGNLAYGIEAAAQTYFHKSAPELSLAECALLAGIVQNAVFNDPLTNFDNAKARQEIALGLMAQNAFITEGEALTAQAETLQFGSTRFPIEAPHFVMAVWEQLQREFPQDLFNEGLDVITTVDLNWQRTAQKITNLQLSYLNHPPTNDRVSANANNAAIVALDPFTGQVLTLLGSPDYFDESIDGAVNAAFSFRQPGSTLKPFTYAAAMNPELDAPYTPATLMLDVETPFITERLESYVPHNFGFVEHGPVLAREALAGSYNIPAVVALEHVGLNNFVDFVEEIGLESLTQNTAVDLSITLGGGEVRLFDLVQAYSIFPNGGYRIEPSLLLKVATRDGRTLYEWEAPALNQRVLDERVAFLITDILSDNEARIPAFGPNSSLQIGRPAAAKTGTTTDFRDNWVLGYTPNLVVGIWVGNADNTPMVEVTGISGAGPIYNQFMRQVLLDQPELEFQKPDGLMQLEVCALSGLLPTPQCPRTRTDWFIPGTEPSGFDKFYQEFTIDRRTGLLADDSTPRSERVVQTFIVLPQEAQDWAVAHGWRQPPLGAISAVSDTQTGLRLLAPDPYTVFEISPVTPQETQRLRLRVATSPGTQQVTYYLNGEAIGSAETAPYAVWWTLELGEHELIAEALLDDGSSERSEVTVFSVVDYEPPQPRIIMPGE